MTDDPTSNPAIAAEPDDSIDLVELATKFIVEWRIFAALSLLVFFLGVAMIYSIKPLFEAYASILPQGAGEAPSAVSLFGPRSTSEIFFGLLASRSVQDEVIDRLNLLNAYHTTDMEIARLRLASSTISSPGRGGIVVIQVREENAGQAARIANAYLEALQTQREKMIQSEFEIHNRFFLQQLKSEEDALAAAERDFRDVQEATGVVQPDSQTQIGLNAIANARAQISNLQVQLSSLLLGESEQNPQVKELRAQIAGLEAHEHALESANSPKATGAAASARNMPQLNLDYSRKLREVRYHEALVGSISSQYESNRLKAGDSGAQFVVVDRAIAPERKAWPQRRMLLLLDAAAALLAGAVGVAALLFWRRLKSEPRNQFHLAEIRRSFRGSR